MDAIIDTPPFPLRACVIVPFLLSFVTALVFVLHDMFDVGPNFSDGLVILIVYMRLVALSCPRNGVGFEAVVHHQAPER